MLSPKEYITLCSKDNFFRMGCLAATNPSEMKEKKPLMWSEGEWALYVLGARETKLIFGDPKNE